MARYSTRTASISLVAALAFGSAGCGSSVDTTSQGTTGAGGGGTTTTTGAGGEGGGVTSTSAGGAGGAGGAPTICGGKLGKPCASDEFCDYGDDTCGIADGSGLCTPRPQTCPDIYQPTCSCDGTVYSSACDANAAGLDVSVNGFCPPPSVELFPCGAGFCDKATSYCQRTLSDVGGTADDFRCQPLPNGCGGVGTCACVSGEPCAASCDEGSGGVELTCPGG